MTINSPYFMPFIRQIANYSILLVKKKIIFLAGFKKMLNFAANLHIRKVLIL